jgi:hypothetical protein
LNHRFPQGTALLCAALTSTALGVALPSAAGAAGTRTTFLLSRSADGGFPNGPSRNPAVSHGQRIARVMAYEADASNIVAGDTNGATDVFVVNRAGPWGEHGTPWTIGGTSLASAGLGGAPADGPSSKPSLDGDSHHAPRCVAFVSDASTLVEGDTDGVADAFVRDLRTGVTTRVSVATSGQQADGPTTDVSIDGACERVAFTSSASNLAGGGARRIRARAAQAATEQVYVHIIRGTGHDAGFAGLTFLASASDRGSAGNGESFEPSFARAGKAVVFTSRASNLVSGDANGTTDVYERTFTRKFSSRRGRGQQSLRFETRLVSATPSGRAGNGPSSHPDSSDDGRYVAYQTAASDLLAGDSNGVTDVAQADLRGQRVAQTWVSKSKATTIGNGSSQNPSISGAGEFVLFDSDATNLKESSHIRDDANGHRDLFLWNRPTGNVSLESRAAPAAPGAKGDYLDIGSGAPATSSRGNYVGFVTKGTNIDLPLVAQLRLAPPEPEHDLVYVRYLGEK